MFLLSGWLQSAAYSLLLGDSLLSDRTTWGHLWGRQVDLFVILIIVLTDHDCHKGWLAIAKLKPLSLFISLF